MGRHKTVPDDDVLAAARKVFREQGHAASTRDIAEVAGVSQAVLYQRFGSKEELFFRSMVPSAPDLEEMLGPAEPGDDPHSYLRPVVERLARYFAEVLPVAIQVMMHPSFDMDTFTRLESMHAAWRWTRSTRWRSRSGRPARSTPTAGSSSAAGRSSGAPPRMGRRTLPLESPTARTDPRDLRRGRRDAQDAPGPAGLGTRGARERLRPAGTPREALIGAGPARARGTAGTRTRSPRPSSLPAAFTLRRVRSRARR